MQIESRQIFKHAAIIAKAIGFFPAIMIGVYLLKKEYQPAYMPYEMLLALGFGYLGYIQMWHKEWLEMKLNKGSFLPKLLTALEYVAAFIVLMFCVNRMTEPIYLKVFFFVYCLALYISNIGDYIKPYHQVLNIENLVFITAVYIIAMAFTKISCLGIIYILIVAVYIFISNQSRLEGLLKLTRENTPMVKNIKRDNMRWVCLLMSVILIAYPLRRQLGKLIEWIFILFLTLVLKFFGLIIALLNLILGEGETQTEGTAGAAGKIEAAEGNPIADDILMLILAVLLIIYVVKNRKKIIKHIEEVMQRLTAMMKRLYVFLFGKRKTVSSKQEYYMETVESIDQNVTFSMEIQKNMTRRQWRHQVKKYLKQLSSEASYRRGYQLILQGAKIKGIELKQSETPREILEQIEGKLELKSLPEGTKIYEDVRYGEVSTAMQELEKAAGILRQLLEIC